MTGVQTCALPILMLARLAFIIRAYNARVGPLETMSMIPIRSLFMNRAASRLVLPFLSDPVLAGTCRCGVATACQSDFLSWPPVYTSEQPASRDGAPLTGSDRTIQPMRRDAAPVSQQDWPRWYAANRLTSESPKGER